MGATVGAILAQVVVAIIGYLQQRADTRTAFLREFERPANDAALVALGWKADAAAGGDGGAQLRVRDGAGAVPLPPFATCPHCGAALLSPAEPAGPGVGGGAVPGGGGA